MARSAIVVAHPDDEVLWFASKLETVDNIVFCYADVPGNPRLTEARKRWSTACSLKFSSLRIDETGALNSADWGDPVLSVCGLKTRFRGSTQTRYEAAFANLVDCLVTELADYQTVFTHNPWGEYGNEEHVQVCRAVQTVQLILGFECWHSGYASPKSERLMSRYDFAGAKSMTISIDQAIKGRYIELHQRSGCWTWYEDWERFESEVFYSGLSLKSGNANGECPPLVNRVRADAGHLIIPRRTIPKIIHQIWIGPLEPPMEWIDTWRQAHPDWEHRLWTESDFDFPLTCLRQLLLSPDFAGMGDVLRYEILRRFGGIYLDADSVCLRPLDEELLEKDFLVAYENELARPGLVAPGVVGCRPHHPIVNKLVESISTLTPEQMSGDGYIVTGPNLITRVVEKHGGVDVMSSFYFYPYHFTGEKCSDAELDAAYAVQIWASTDYDSDLIGSIRNKYGHKQRAYCGNRVVGQMPAILDGVVRRNENVQMRSRHVLAEPGSDSGYRLSEAAVTTLKLCSEGLTVQGIIDVLARALPADAAQIQQDVYELICEFIRKGIVTVGGQNIHRPIVTS